MSLLTTPLKVVHDTIAAQSPDALRASSDLGIPALLHQQFGLDAANGTPIPGSLAQIPSLNDTPSEQIAPNTLVRFRCMVQDMMDTEFYLGVFEEVHAETKARQLRTSKYADALQLSEKCEVDFNAPSSIRYDRLPLFCVSVPGESAWVQTTTSTAASPTSRPSSATKRSTTAKRQRDDDDTQMGGSGSSSSSDGAAKVEAASQGDGDGDASMTPSSAGDSGSPSKRVRGNGDGDGDDDAAAATHSLIERAAQKSQIQVVVKVYDDAMTAFKVADMVEFIGVFAVDPQLHEEGGAGGDDAEYNATHPAPSLVHRLHAITYHRLPVTFPLGVPVPVPTPPSAEEVAAAKAAAKAAVKAAEPPSTQPAAAKPPSPSEQAFAAVVDRMRPGVVNVRASLLAYMATVLGGDGAAAEMLLALCLSRVRSRVMGSVIGKFSVNLSGHPVTVSEGKPLVAQMLELLLPRTRVVDLANDKMNAERLVPVKNYDTNRLEQGKLQLVAGTPLIVDETRMATGTLNDKGCRNLQAIQTVVNEQKVVYDFMYHHLDFPVDMPTLVLSAAKSLFKTEFRVHLRPTAPLPTLLPPVDDAGLQQWRSYIAAARELTFDIGDDAEVNKMVEADFVAMRQADAKSSQDDLHLRLTLARLLGVSFFEHTLTVQRWKYALAGIDQVRANLPPPPATTTKT
jgi:hypothetical protein